MEDSPCIQVEYLQKPHLCQPECTDCPPLTDRKSTRLNSSHVRISYAVFCLKKKKKDPISCQFNRSADVSNGLESKHNPEADHSQSKTRSSLEVRSIRAVNHHNTILIDVMSLPLAYRWTQSTSSPLCTVVSHDMSHRVRSCLESAPHDASATRSVFFHALYLNSMLSFHFLYPIFRIAIPKLPPYPSIFRLP